MTEEQYAALKAASKKNNQPMAELLRGLLDKLIGGTTSRVFRFTCNPYFGSAQRVEITVPLSVVDEARQIVRDGRKIEAIKLLREKVQYAEGGCLSLYDAKSIADILQGTRSECEPPSGPRSEELLDGERFDLGRYGHVTVPHAIVAKAKRLMSLPQGTGIAPFIEAVKCVKQEAGLGLPQAKTVCDILRDALNATATH